MSVVDAPMLRWLGALGRCKNFSEISRRFLRVSILPWHTNSFWDRLGAEQPNGEAYPSWFGSGRQRGSGRQAQSHEGTRATTHLNITRIVLHKKLLQPLRTGPRRRQETRSGTNQREARATFIFAT